MKINDKVFYYCKISNQIQQGFVKSLTKKGVFISRLNPDGTEYEVPVGGLSTCVDGVWSFVPSNMTEIYTVKVSPKHIVPTVT